MDNPFEQISNQLSEIKTLLANNPGVPIAPNVQQPVTSEELCEFLRISEPSLLRLKKKKAIPFIQVGNLIRYDKAAVIKALEKNAKV